ncbi:Histone H4 [Lasiodiplodia theobromae]|uniref:Ceramide-binding protein SVF1 n=1 Tax=Lasiodiplodia theobromae TaxID=45133 RepID=A0A5N5DM14_9PEZI|nr:Svp1-like protein [Lasiodiplodia theobromae]KAB2578787.1 Survival factor 1 [Lasiodiplodia theobromae]KAF4535301.1 Svp1-like protein [Lasiodiplodia theobromae]KAF9638578.1 Histone H4 [Lasiodiplodia theobromae]
MFNWAKQQLANVAGTQEPIYGPEAIQPVTKQAAETPYTELQKDDLKWVAMESTCVETQTFYLTADSGHLAMVQVIYSNVAGIRTTCQFNCKVFYQDGGKTPHLWSSDPLSNHRFDEAKHSFYADNCSVELAADGSSYTIKSSTNKQSIVTLKFTRTAPGFVVGKNGTSYFGTDPANPWGSMRHAFWPRCKVEGSILTKAGEIDFAGRGFFVHALQGMKPHHAAASWNFVNFQSPTYSAVMMEYVTPPSYGSTVVSVGGIATEGALIFAGAHNTAKHTEKKQDTDNDWPEPVSASYVWNGKTADGKDVHADLTGSLGPRVDRVDVMAEVPGFVKAIVASAAGTKPYIYQYTPKLTIKVKVGDEEKTEEGLLFTEATFIS